MSAFQEHLSQRSNSVLLAGRTYVVAGRSQDYTQPHLKQIIESNGGRVIAEPSKAITHILIPHELDDKTKELSLYKKSINKNSQVSIETIEKLRSFISSHGAYFPLNSSGYKSEQTLPVLLHTSIGVEEKSGESVPTTSSLALSGANSAASFESQVDFPKSQSVARAQNDESSSGSEVKVTLKKPVEANEGESSDSEVKVTAKSKKERKENETSEEYRSRRRAEKAERKKRKEERREKKRQKKLEKKARETGDDNATIPSLKRNAEELPQDAFESPSKKAKLSSPGELNSANPSLPDLASAEISSGPDKYQCLRHLAKTFKPFFFDSSRTVEPQWKASVHQLPERAASEGLAGFRVAGVPESFMGFIHSACPVSAPRYAVGTRLASCKRLYNPHRQDDIILALQSFKKFYDWKGAAPQVDVQETWEFYKVVSLDDHGCPVLSPTPKISSVASPTSTHPAGNLFMIESEWRVSPSPEIVNGEFVSQWSDEDHAFIDKSNLPLQIYDDKKVYLDYSYHLQ